MRIRGSHNIVSENHVYYCTKYGIGGTNSKWNTFYNNEVAFGDGNGMNYIGGSNCNVTKNIISNNKYCSISKVKW